MSDTGSDRSPGPIAGLDEALAHLRDYRDRTRKKALITLGVICGIGLFLGVNSAIAGHGFQPLYLLIGLVVGFFVYMSIMRGVKLQYKRIIVPSILKDIDPGLAYNPSGYIPREEFRRSKIFSQRPDSYTGEDLVYGSYKGIPIRFCELTVQEAHRGDDKQTTYVTFFKGVFMIADFNKDFKYSHWVLPDTAEAAFGQVFGNFLQKLKLPGRGHMTRMEDPTFEKKFVVYTEDDVEARYILSPKLMHTMVNLASHFRRGGSGLAFAFMNSNVCVAIPLPGGSNLFEMPSFGNLGAETARQTRDELREILNVFDVMDLDLRIWSKSHPYRRP